MEKQEKFFTNKAGSILKFVIHEDGTRVIIVFEKGVGMCYKFDDEKEVKQLIKQLKKSLNKP